MAKALLLVHLSLLLASCIIVYGVEIDAETPSMEPTPPHPRFRHSNHSPANSPTKPPVHYTTPPSPPPHIPGFIPRSIVRVQGVVFCQSCKFAGIDTLLGATPIVGATVKLECFNSHFGVNVFGKTDHNGYFLIEAPKTISNNEAHSCKVFLVDSPLDSCKKPSNLQGGVTGAELRFQTFFESKPPVALYTVGPFAFEPQCPR